MNSQRIILLTMIFVLPFWLTFGRMLSGSIGWLTFIYLFIVGPILLFLLAADLLLRIRTTWSVIDTVIHWLLYASVFLHGIFLPDGDTEDSVVSVFSHFAGNKFIDISGVLALIFLVASLVLLAVVLVKAVIAQVLAMRERANVPPRSRVIDQTD